MARKVNSSFNGVSIFDVDPNALTRRRIFEEAAGDTALVHDLVTGENSPTINLNHAGGGTGCPLGLPLANSPLEDYVIYGTGDGAVERVCAWSIGHVQPFGETTMTLSARLSEPIQGAIFEVRNTSWDVVAQVSFRQGTRILETLTDLVAGSFYFYRLVIEDISSLFGGVTISHLHLGHFRAAVGVPLMGAVVSDADENVVPRKTVSGAQVMAPEWFDDDEVETDQRAVSSHIVQTLSQQQHCLLEYLTGSPAGGNSTRRLVPSSTQSAWADGSQLGSEYSSAPLIGMIPLAAWGMGAAPDDGRLGSDGVGGIGALASGVPRSKGCPGWSFAAGSGYRELVDIDLMIPHDDLSRLSLICLAYSPDLSINDTTTPVLRLSTPVDDESTGTWTHLADGWYFAAVQNVEYTSPQFGANRVSITIQCLSRKGADGGSLRIAGLTLGVIPS